MNNHVRMLPTMMNCPGHTFQDAASPTAALVSVSRTYMFESRLH